MANGIVYMFSIFMIILAQISLVDGGGTWPRCESGCTANDVSISRVYLTAPAPCTAGETTSVDLWGTFVVNTASTRDCPFSVIDIYLNNNTYKINHVTWLGVIAGAGTYERKLATIDYTCGQEVSLKNIYVQWSAEKKSCGENCNNYQSSKCYYDSGPIIVPPPLFADFSGYDICLGGSIQFEDKTSGGYTPYQSYHWDFGDGSTYSGSTPPPHKYSYAGKYTVTLTVTDKRGIISSKSREFYVWEHPVADFTYIQQCGFDVQFRDASTAKPTAGITPYISGWSWDFNNDGIADNTFQNPTYTFTAAGTYPVKLTVTDSNGCSSSVIKNVVVEPADVATAASNSPVCEGSTIQLTGGPDGMKSYSWTGPNDFTSNSQSPSITSATVSNAGIYTLTVVDNNNCVTSANTLVTVKEKPQVSVGRDISICENENGVLLNGTNTGGPATYLWTTSGTGTFSNPDQLSTYYYPSDADISSGQVQITLTATAISPCNQVSSDSLTISILRIPNALINVLFPNNMLYFPIIQAKLHGGILNANK